MTLRSRMEKMVDEGRAANWPTHEIVRRQLDEMMKPSKEVIAQGCVALIDKQRILQAAKWSVDRHELARIKMEIRWKAMIKSLLRGM